MTLVEGPVALLRTAGRFALSEGVRVQAGDIVEVADKALAQIELADGARISLGPRSRFHVASLATAGATGRGGKASPVSDLYLLQGWTKIALAPQGLPVRVTTPLFGLGTAEGIFVLHVEGAVDPDGAREAPEFTLDQVVRLLLIRRRGRLLAGHEQHVGAKDHPERLDRDARHIDDRRVRQIDRIEGRWADV